MRGFTLIEILVVILIISITMTFALFSFGDFGAKRRAVTAAEQFAAYVGLVRLEAILEANTLGIRVNNDGYEVLRFQEPDSWQPMKQGIFRHRTFPARIQVQMQTNKSNRPAIFVNASGDMSAFEIKFGTAKQDNRVTVHGKSDGFIAVTTP